MTIEDFEPDSAFGRRTGGRLLRLAVRCPRCGMAPALRITEEAGQDAGRHPPNLRIATYQCRTRRCGEIYDLCAAAFQRAT